MTEMNVNQNIAHTKKQCIKQENSVSLMFYQLSVFNNGEICCAAGPSRPSKLALPSGITEAKIRPALALCLEVCVPLNASYFGCQHLSAGKKEEKIFEMNACGAPDAVSVRVLESYLGLKYIRGDSRAVAAEQEGGTCAKRNSGADKCFKC